MIVRGQLFREITSDFNRRRVRMNIWVCRRQRVVCDRYSVEGKCQLAWNGVQQYDKCRAHYWTATRQAALPRPLRSQPCYQVPRLCVQHTHMGKLVSVVDLFLLYQSSFGVSFVFFLRYKWRSGVKCGSADMRILSM